MSKTPCRARGVFPSTTSVLDQRSLPPNGYLPCQAPRNTPVLPQGCLELLLNLCPRLARLMYERNISRELFNRYTSITLGSVFPLVFSCPSLAQPRPYKLPPVSVMSYVVTETRSEIAVWAMQDDSCQPHFYPPLYCPPGKL